jgi:hypothetical protein
MEVNGDKKSIQISSNSSPLVFCTVSKTVQAPVVTYDDIFQALVEGEVLLLEPLLDPITLTIQPQLGPLGLSRVRQSGKTSPRPTISI